MQLLECKTESELTSIVNNCELDFDIRIHAEMEILRWRLFQPEPEDEISLRTEWKRDVKHKASKRVHIACEELNFFWNDEDLEYFKFLLKRGFNITQIAEELDRKYEEVAVLVLDRGMAH